MNKNATTEKELTETAVKKGLAVVETVKYFRDELNRVIAASTKRKIVASCLYSVGIGAGTCQVHFSLKEDDRNNVGEAFVLVEGKTVKVSIRKYTKHGQWGSAYVNLYGKSVKKQFERFEMV
ncbi:hypothetical protein [Fibrobacter sp.]|uniref:hypothetical protein n=1 Tax=Fibrobacter sp. TaxID=35828 RepID=UPI003868017A